MKTFLTQPWRLAALLLIKGALSCHAAETFDNIIVSPQAPYAGETHRGYHEFRVLLENQSAKETHLVSLMFPDRTFRSGNSIRSISRTVVLAPKSRALVPLWQPPLPVYGNAQLRVEIDREYAGSVSVPNANRHVSRGPYGPGHLRHRAGGKPPSILISRSLNSDDLSLALRGKSRVAFSPAMAAGGPDSGGRRGIVDSCWMPDPSHAGPHWIELDYEPPRTAETVQIFENTTVRQSFQVVLKSADGKELQRLTSPAASAPRGGRSSVWSRTLTVPLTAEPVKTVRLEWASTPPHSVAVDAVQISGPWGSAYAAEARASSHDMTSVVHATPGSPGADPFNIMRSEWPVNEWSEHWLAYTPFDAIALSGQDFKTMSPAVAQTLWRYAECGGNLVVLGATAIPDPWAKLESSSEEWGTRGDIGFGQFLIFNAEKPDDISSDGIKAISLAAANVANVWRNLPNETSANSEFAVVENLRVPVRGIVFIMLGFILLIGPVNLFVLSKLNRRIWMLWTIPATSLAACGLVFAYTMLSEGITPDVRVESVTVLDQVNHRATSVGAAAFYCPLTPNQGLTFSYETEVTPLIEMWDHRSGTVREVDWTQAQHLARGWVTARVPAHFLFRKSETRRERLQIESRGEQLEVVNGLGAPIQSLWLADANGKIFAGENIAAGEKTALAPWNETPRTTGSPKSLRAVLQDSGYGHYADNLATNAFDHLRPGTYVAELGESPFIEKPLGSRVAPRAQNRSVIFGFLDSNRTR